MNHLKATFGMPDDVREAMKSFFDKVDSAALYGAGKGTGEVDITDSPDNGTVPKRYDFNELRRIMTEPVHQPYPTDMWQVCPLCKGSGHKWPVGLSINSGPAKCPVCKGHMIICTFTGKPPVTSPEEPTE